MKKHLICVCCCLSLFPAFSVAGRPFKAEVGKYGWRSTPVNGGKPELQGHTKAVDDEGGGGGIVTTSSSRKTGCVMNEKSVKEALDCDCDVGDADCRTTQPGGAASYYDPNNNRLGEHTLTSKYYGSATYVAPQDP